MQRAPFQQQLAAVAGLIGITVVWGVTFIMVKWTVVDVDVSCFLFLRFTIAFLALAIFFHRHLLTTDRATIRAAFIMSLFLGAAYFTQSEGLRFTSASNSALITGLYIVLVPIFSNIWYKARPHFLSIIGMIISLVGLYLLTQFDASGMNIGDAVTLLCAVACAWHILLTGAFTNRHRIISLVIFQFLFVALFTGAAALIKGKLTLHLPTIGWITIFVTAIFATAFTFVIQTAAQRIVDPTRTGLIFALEAVFGVLFACWWGGEVMTPSAIYGASLMVLGMMISEIPPVARFMIEKIVG